MTVGFSGIIMALFITFQMLFPFMPFYALGCLFATCAIHSFIYREKDIEHGRAMENVNRKAFVDGLTGVKNKLAYLESLRELEMHAKENSYLGYGVVVFDLNGLKVINDTLGHEAGDEYLKSACRLICEIYKHSPVYRIGGDEFVVILKGSDFDNRELHNEQFDKTIDENRSKGSVVVSSGMAVFDPGIDESYTEVFIRADKKMYERKMALKATD
jgi:diguanylate cyclase (GGDEF)-like protein